MKIAGAAKVLGGLSLALGGLGDPEVVFNNALEGASTAFEGLEGSTSSISKAADGVSIAFKGLKEPGAIVQAIGSLPIIVGGYMMTKKHHKLPENEQRKENSKEKISFAKKHPIITSSAVQFAGRPLILAAGIAQGDLGLISKAIFCGAGDTALAATDKNLQQDLVKKDQDKNHQNNNLKPQ